MRKLSLALLLGVAALPAHAIAATRVSSDSGCPSSDAISQRLLGLLAAGGPAIASARVRVEATTMRIELSTPGEVNEERTVPASSDCDERAEMAAFIIASWLDVMPVGTISTPGVPPRPPQSIPPEPSAEPDSLDEAASQPIALGTHTLVGVGFFGIADSKGGSAGFALDAGMPNLVEYLGWNAEASLGLPRGMAVGQGTARYWRPTFALAATGDVRTQRWAFRPQVAGVLGILSIQGSGFNTENVPATTTTWGAAAGVTVARPWRRDEFWLRCEAVLWPQGRAVRSKQLPSGLDVVVPFPEYELRLTVGVSWGIH